ncbi:AbiH family protein [Mucilaginibacter sp. X5P1]|uniref:AbiH family protein n=1 Tax=Mucilaginibacter sp. X5P1 TaxID=2723088 RepID=UPI001618FF56|nr:AbiH family protein [Mucilaginibacter sp. X5P1]MBB6141077.1 hypothetical protein [Mucilaginibacter sp. X5P1]
MNRLILIGNGFDLAHGLKTSYKDFILWYVKSCFEKAHKDKNYEDRLITITSTNYVYNNPEHRSRWVNDYLSTIEHPKRKNKVTWSGWNGDNRKLDMSPFKIDYKSNLLEPLLSRCNVSNWVDIESEYYELLKDVLELNDEEVKQPQLIELNESLAFIISQLEIYLTNLAPTPFIEEYDQIFSSKIRAADLYPKRSDTTLIPTQTYVLNFNYTNTSQQYIDKLGSPSGSTAILNYIHGKLKDTVNELIFGFGDEIDQAYKKMEDDSKVKGYFDYIKSFWYLRTDNYRSLVNFLDLDDYQVYVLGHSCGLSDRTMLQMIFEHPKCRSIKIYYHERNGVDNFVSLTHEISRHFTDKGLMRKKILSKRRSERMPQHDDQHSDISG